MRMKAKPKSVIKIRKLTNAIRDMLGISVDEAVNGPMVFERLYFLFEEYGYDYQALEDDDTRLEPNEEAKIDITTGKIYIKQSVYQSAANDKFSRALFTLFHEEGHFFMHRLPGFTLSRTCPGEKIKTYEDPEWQANTFAAEFLMPYDGCIGLTAIEIKKKYNVSYAAAKSRYRNINKG